MIIFIYKKHFDESEECQKVCEGEDIDSTNFRGNEFVHMKPTTKSGGEKIINGLFAIQSDINFHWIE